MCFIRASTLNNADIALLKRAGCIEVQIGLESGDTEILKNMNKQVEPETYKNVIRKLFKNGINVSCYFISGFPGETEETAQRTREFIKSIEHPELPGILSWSIYPFILSPLSPIYEPEMRKKYELYGYLNKWEHKTMDSRKAKEIVKDIYFSLKNSSQIYRGDNLETMYSFDALKRKDFYLLRQKLSKEVLVKNIENNELIERIRELNLAD
jgi:radical SAM superfamily enzyme YgiQ (UPF0313 family)